MRLVGVMNDRTRPRARTAEEVHGFVFDAITDQRLLPGTKLSELALVETFGLGRRVVGLALQRLAWEGLVRIHPNRGAFVAVPDADEAREVFAARVAIEGGTTEAVARGGDPDACTALLDNLAQERRAREEGRARDAIGLSGGFHVLMAELSGNRILAAQVRLLVARTSLVIALFGNEDALACWHDHHADLVHLCAERRAEAAASLMREHLRDLERGLALDRRRPGGFDPLRVFGA